jgi:hypothetical protein
MTRGINNAISAISPLLFGTAQHFDPLTLRLFIEFASGVQGSVRVVASASVLAEHLADDIGAFLAANPAVRGSLDERVSPAIGQVQSTPSSALPSRTARSPMPGPRGAS